MSKRTILLSLLLLPIIAVAAHAADFDPNAATNAYLAQITGEARAKSDAYFEGGYWLILYDTLYAIGVSLLLLFTRVASGLRGLMERTLPWRWLQTFGFIVVFTVLTSALSFPLTMYEGFTREHAFGLSNQTYGQWFNEYMIGLGIGTIMGGLFLTIVYAIIRRAPNTWWIWGAGAVSVFFAFSALVGPVFISPLFNDYKPMRDGELKQQILSLARANGIPVTDVFEVDASRQSIPCVLRSPPFVCVAQREATLESRDLIGKHRLHDERMHGAEPRRVNRTVRSAECWGRRLLASETTNGATQER